MRWKSIENCFDSGGRQDIFLSSEASGTTLEPNKPPINPYPANVENMVSP